MLIFITAKPNHPTKKQIINTFMKAGLPYDLINPSTPWFKMRKKFQRDVSVCILAPDHPNSFKICSYLASSRIPIINPPRTTLLCRSRIAVQEKIISIFHEFLGNKSESIRFPQSNYYKTKNLFYTKILDSNFPLVIKYPHNHSGIHFTELFDQKDQIKGKLPKWVNSVGIYVEKFIEAQDILIKAYYICGHVITQKDTHHLSLDRDPSLKTKILETKNQRKTIDNAPEIEEFLKLIANKLDIVYFGVDFLKTKENEYWMVDFNDFPGARGIFNAGELIANYVINLGN